MWFLLVCVASMRFRALIDLAGWLFQNLSGLSIFNQNDTYDPETIWLAGVGTHCSLFGGVV